MKKNFIYFLTLFAMTTVISCNDKDDPKPGIEPIEPIEPLAGPTIMWESNPDFDEMEITEEMDVKIKVEAPAGIKTFKIKVDSEVLNEKDITEIDLIEPGENVKQYMKMILGGAGSPKDKTSYSLDLSTCVPMINTLTTEESDHTFTVTVSDKNDSTATKTAVFHRRKALPDPTIAWESNPNFKKMNIIGEMDVKIKVEAPACIKSINVVVESEALKTLGITEIDLIDPDENVKQYAAMILGDAGNPKDALSCTLDLSKLVSKINTLTTDESDHTFTVKVEDKNGRTVTKDAVFHRIGEFKLGQNFTELVSNMTFEMIYVEGGTFDMGATEEQGMDDPDQREYPVHSVTLSAYYIGKFEVTQGLWKAVMSSNPSSFQNGDDYPVENVSWDEAREFCTKLSQLTGRTYVLPTEAQWEYAARGGTKSQGYKYSGSDNIEKVAWYGDNSGTRTQPVGRKDPNELGIYDMSGNVEEWCNDMYSSYSAEAQTDPTGPTTGSNRVLRGGSWFGYAKYCRVSYRYYNNSSNQYNINGFRVVLLLD